MKTKEEYYEQTVLKNRDLVKNPEIMKCPCPSTLCDWHGKCHQCVALHRYNGDHVPTCLQPIINDKLKELVKVGELVATEKQGTPIEYRHYVKERDRQVQEK